MARDEKGHFVADEQAPDINDPKDGNKIVSPDNLHTDPYPGRYDENPPDKK